MELMKLFLIVATQIILIKANCGTFDSSKFTCCNGNLYGGRNLTCCGTGAAYNPNNATCCIDTVFSGS